MSDAELPGQAGEGATEVAVGDADGKVILRFPKPVTWIALDPQIAPHVAESMIHAAGRCGVKVEIKVPPKVINQQTQAMLVTRAAHVMRSLQSRGKAPEVIASELVDVVLREVL